MMWWMPSWVSMYCWWCTYPNLEPSTSTTTTTTPASTMQPPDKDYGRSPGYQIASELLNASLDFSVDPCQDFYQFTCGNWIRSHPIKGHHVFLSHMIMVTEKVETEMKGLLKSGDTYGSKSIRALKSIYKKCMDQDSINRIGATRLFQDAKGFGVVPIIEGEQKWREDKFDLTSLLVHASRIRGVNVFVNYEIAKDLRNVSRSLIVFDQVDLMAEALGAYLLDRYNHYEEIRTYKDYLVNMVMEIQKDNNLPTNKYKTERDAEEIIELETQIANILAPDEERRDFSQWSHQNLDFVQERMPLVDWTRFFRGIAPPAAQQYVKSNPLVIIKEIDYLRRINDVLKRANPRVVTNYVFLRYATKWKNEMGEKYDNLAHELDRVGYGQQEKEPRWKTCSRSTMEQLMYATSAMYARNFFDKESKNAVLELITNLQKEFRQGIKANLWMDAKTKEEAIHKSKKTLRHVGFPDFVLNTTLLDKYYEGLEVLDTYPYSKMLEKTSRWKIEHAFESLLKPVDHSEFESSAAEVNAFYSPTSNAIDFPAAILQPPFFHHTFPKALNYGGIGATIGHEMTHGFDDQGRQFDADGNLRDWWDPYTKRQFEAKAQCMVRQYGKIKVPGTNEYLNGVRTQGENIADNGAVKYAYRAYKRFLTQHGGFEQRIKGFERFDNNQMFFIGYALPECENLTPEALMSQILGDQHSPVRYRINTVLSNQEEFARAFQCPRGTPMNPYQRCAVW